jgi:hypothetical protein
VVGRPAATERRADSPRRSSHWLARAAEIFRALVLSAPAYRGLFRSAVPSPPTHVEAARDDVAPRR